MARTSREVAFQILLSWERDQSQTIDSILSKEMGKHRVPRDGRSWVTELTYGTIRQRLFLDQIISPAFKGRYQKAQHGVKVLLRMGAYQLLFMKTLDHAAIHETVALAKRVRLAQSSGLINAVLRKIQTSDTDQVLEKIIDPILKKAVRYSHPQWMMERWIGQFGDAATIKLCEYNNRSPHLWIRRNVLCTEAEAFETFLARENIEFERSPVLEAFYRLHHAGDLIATPEFKSGWFSFQDLAAGLVAKMLDPAPGERIVDACSAPGGKLAYMAELAGNKAIIVGCDASLSRLARVKENIERLHLLNVTLKAQDAATAAFPQADKILLDVPCSGTGVLGRRPDSRWRKQAGDLKNLVAIQSGILKNSWKSLKSGGLLVYATCSLEGEENWEQIDATLEHLPNSYIEPWDLEKFKPFIDDRGALSTLPWIHQMDGMFAVRIRKKV